MLETYTLPQIKEAVDIAVGDDGNRSEEVIEILKQSEKSRYEDTLDRVRETKMLDITKLEEKVIDIQQQIVNIDAKYKFKLNEIHLILESLNNNKKEDYVPIVSQLKEE